MHCLLRSRRSTHTALLVQVLDTSLSVCYGVVARRRLHFGLGNGKVAENNWPKLVSLPPLRAGSRASLRERQRLRRALAGIKMHPHLNHQRAASSRQRWMLACKSFAIRARRIRPELENAATRLGSLKRNCLLQLHL